MPERTLEERVRLIEQQFGSKTLEEHFRAQAELLDQHFLAVDERFAAIDGRLTHLDGRVDAITKELAVVRQGVEMLLKRAIKRRHCVSSPKGSCLVRGSI